VLISTCGRWCCLAPLHSIVHSSMHSRVQRKSRRMCAGMSTVSVQYAEQVCIFRSDKYKITRKGNLTSCYFVLWYFVTLLVGFDQTPQVRLDNFISLIFCPSASAFTFVRAS